MQIFSLTLPTDSRFNPCGAWVEALADRKILNPFDTYYKLRYFVLR